MTSDMSDTHYHGEEISADTYATLRRHQFNLESPEERLQRIENTIATMKEKWRRGDEAMRDFTDSTKDTKVDQPVNYSHLLRLFEGTKDSTKDTKVDQPVNYSHLLRLFEGTKDVLSRAWAHVKWEEDVARHTKVQRKQDPKTIRPDQTEQDEKPSQRPARDSENRNRGRYQNRPIEKAEGMAVSTWPDISHLSVSRPELINVLRQMGQQDCITLKIEVNELLKKRHLREFLSEKAMSHLSKETTGKPTKAAPVSPPRQDRLIHVISGGTDEISFTAKEQEKVLTPHHDALIISLTVANCLVKRILVDNGSSSNIIFQAAYKDLGLEESTLTRRIIPLIRFSGEVKQTASVGEKYSGIEFFLTPGKTSASGSPLRGTPVPRYGVLRVRSRDRSPSPGKRKTSDKENLPYFRIWKSLTYSNQLRPALRRLYKGNLNPRARDGHSET
ncbi:hypothetical protein DY000_02040906 [Brassica cretica]|uniref:Aspartic peptidase DDI1-type domain-containing protein n=1 Tax=Brassica cretica TaxID=69181 RepID=A0ABQ7BC26_BRACR|nr:hypothetical protein DY000_02040906 [Brassica cretica]